MKALGLFLTLLTTSCATMMTGGEKAELTQWGDFSLHLDERGWITFYGKTNGYNASSAKVESLKSKISTILKWDQTSRRSKSTINKKVGALSIGGPVVYFVKTQNGIAYGKVCFRNHEYQHIEDTKCSVATTDTLRRMLSSDLSNSSVQKVKNEIQNKRSLSSSLN